MVKSADRKTEEEKTAQQTNAEAEAENAVTPEVQDTDGLSEEDKTLYRQAKYAAKQYDYDKAISMLQNSETYQTSEKFQHAVKVYQKRGILRFLAVRPGDTRLLSYSDQRYR